MANIVQKQLQQAMLALLQQAPALAETVQEARDPSTGFSGASLVSVKVPASEPSGETLSTSPIMWRTTVVVDVEARATTGQTGSDAVSPVAAGVFARVMGDTTLAAAGWQLAEPPAIETDTFEAEDRIGMVRFTWSYLHRSAWANLTTSA